VEKTLLEACPGHLMLFVAGFVVTAGKSLEKPATRALSRELWAQAAALQAVAVYLAAPAKLLLSAEMVL
jgi:hypothetical protein